MILIFKFGFWFHQSFQYKYGYDELLKLIVRVQFEHQIVETTFSEIREKTSLFNNTQNMHEERIKLLI